MMYTAQLFHNIGDEPDVVWMVVGCYDVLDQIRERIAGVAEWALGPTATITNYEADEIVVNRTKAEKHLIYRFNDWMLESA